MVPDPISVATAMGIRSSTTHMHARMHKHTKTRAHTRTHTHVHTHTHTHTHKQSHISTPTHTHSHTKQVTLDCFVARYTYSTYTYFDFKSSVMLPHPMTRR